MRFCAAEVGGGGGSGVARGGSGHYPLLRLMGGGTNGINGEMAKQFSHLCHRNVCHFMPFYAILCHSGLKIEVLANIYSLFAKILSQTDLNAGKYR